MSLRSDRRGGYTGMFILGCSLFAMLTILPSLVPERMEQAISERNIDPTNLFYAESDLFLEAYYEVVKTDDSRRRRAMKQLLSKGESQLGL
ncbi:MAG: hypothetical protein OEQ53_19920 [Saprospiraceae bacterium]|nr:hypothetical protein [Saprospiraceae bacterium]